MLIDFANAIYLGTGWCARRFLLPLLGAIDHSAILKFRHEDFPDLVSAPDHERYRRFRRWPRFWFFGRLWRWVRSIIRRAVAVNSPAKSAEETVSDRWPHQAT